ncbi:Gfo/Idh/MocA family protein [Streptomyces griseorubiginosus]|uniref:Gfo/Idh/MocA family protein n=1 Tax=Streptomyces griseorubiginosus TaxID=67304 RepID=UPI00368CA594
MATSVSPWWRATSCGTDGDEMIVGVVGAGFMARTHIAAWQAAGATDLLLTSHNPAGARALAEEVGITASAGIAGTAARADLIDVCTPTDTHAEIGAVAASAGAHVLVEKPLARDVPQATRLIDTCARAGVTLAVAHVVRFAPEYRRFLDIADSGELGDLATLHLRRLSGPPEWSGWLLDAQRSGGVVLDLMIHDLDIALAAAGPVATVDAEVTGKPGREHAFAMLGHAGGAVSIVEASWAQPNGTFVTSAELVGTKATATIDAAQPIRTDGVHVDTGVQKAYVDQARHLIDVIEHGANLELTPQKALDALKLAEAVSHSARSGKTVHFRTEGN